MHAEAVLGLRTPAAAETSPSSAGGYPGTAQIDNGPDVGFAGHTICPNRSVLLGRGGSSLKLHIAGYRFPHLDPGREPLDGASSDANWLVVAGEVRPTTGTPWSFRHPVLMTWEVTDLARWLRQVANGAVPVATAVGELDETAVDEYAAAGWLTFTEPDLSFAVGAYAGSRVQLLLGLSHESAEPPINQMRPKRSQITVMSDSQQAKDAADALQKQLAAYPAR